MSLNSNIINASYPDLNLQLSIAAPRSCPGGVGGARGENIEQVKLGYLKFILGS